MLSLKLVGGMERCDGARSSVEVPLTQSRYLIGRDPACDWALPDRTLALSARHCEVFRAAAGLLLRDLSTNGTFVNGATTRLLEEHRLRDGDRIDAGPFTFLVGLAGEPPAADLDPGPVVAPAPAPAAVAGTPAVDDTAPLAAMGRGRDPAAAAVLPPAPDEDLGLTRIRPAPKPAARPAVPAPVATPLPVPSPVAAPAAAPELLAALAAGLGLPAHALAGRDPVQLAGQLGALARVAVDSLRSLLEQQARHRRRMGSRRQVELRAASPLRLAANTDAALLDLLTGDPVPPMVQVAADLARHQDQLLSAYRAALLKMGEDLAPAALARAMPTQDPARQWAHYAKLWQRLGLTAEDAPWPAGFLEAALLHLAAAYDQEPPA